MALKRLQTGEMISCSATLVDKNSEVRKLIDSIPTAAAAIAHVEAAHAGLLNTQASAVSAILANLIKQEEVLDLRHDNLAKGTDAVLYGFALVTPDKAEAARLLDLRQTLLPNGLTITQKSFREESGQAKMLQQRLTSSDRAYLKKLPVLNGKLADVVDEWISVGVELGVLEDQRAAEEAKQSQLVSGSETVAARNKWIRSINALVSMLELAEASDDTMAKILGPLRETEKKADRRGNRKEPTPVTPEPAPVPEKPERDE